MKIELKDEPDIVKELREEERSGILSSKSRNEYNDLRYPDGSDINPSRRHQTDDNGPMKCNTIQVSVDYERKLLEAEEKYEKIFRLSPEAIVLIDKNGVLVDMNERLFDWLEYRTDEVIGNTILELPFLTVDEKMKAKKNFLTRMSGKEVASYELEFIAKNGEKKIGLVRGVPIKDELRNITHSLLMISDVTERRKADERLQNTLKQLQELEFIVNHSGAVAFLWRAAEGWPVEFVSENITLFGYTKEELLTGKISYGALVHKDDFSRISEEVIKYSSQGVKEFTQEYRIYTKTGEIRWVDDRTWIRRDDSGTITHYQGIILDITDRKQVEEELKKVHETLSELNKKLEQEIREKSTETKT